jgi:hypothetical protein
LGLALIGISLFGMFCCGTNVGGRPHLGRGLEAQASHGLLGAEDGGGALPEHVEGASRLHCVCVCVCVCE